MTIARAPLLRRVGALAALALLLGGCAVGPRTVTSEVTRFHDATAEAFRGQTVTVLPGASVGKRLAAFAGEQGGEDDAPTGIVTVGPGLAFATYADLTGTMLQALGMRPADDRTAPDLVAYLDYAVDGGKSETVTIPGRLVTMPGYAIGPRGAYTYVPHFAYTQPRSFSRIVFTRRVGLRIDTRVTGETLFEGEAVSVGPSGQIAPVIRPMLTAILQDFPGGDGETTTVRVPLAPPSGDEDAEGASPGS